MSQTKAVLLSVLLLVSCGCKAFHRPSGGCDTEAVQSDQCQTLSKGGLQSWHRTAWAVTPIWKMEHCCPGMAESECDLPQVFHSCGLKAAAGIICIFHTMWTSQSRLLLCIFIKRALQHLSILSSVLLSVGGSGPQVDVKKQAKVGLSGMDRNVMWPCMPGCLGTCHVALPLIRKPKTILKELNWCHCYLQGNRGMRSQGVSSVQNLWVSFCLNSCHTSLSIKKVEWAATKLTWGRVHHKGAQQ